MSRRLSKPEVKPAPAPIEEVPAKTASEAVAVSAYAQIANGAALLLICVMAFSVRLFSVVKYESVIHEFDPYFNYRVTTFLTKEGFYNLWNWFDDRTWYPLGRVVGGTVYPVRAITLVPVHLRAACRRGSCCKRVAACRGSYGRQV